MNVPFKESLLFVCAQICRKTVEHLGSLSRFSIPIAGVCARICKKCAHECEKLSHIGKMRLCGEACKLASLACFEIEESSNDANRPFDLVADR